MEEVVLVYAGQSPLAEKYENNQSANRGSLFGTVGTPKTGMKETRGSTRGAVASQRKRPLRNASLTNGESGGRFCSSRRLESDCDGPCLQLRF